MPNSASRRARERRLRARYRRKVILTGIIMLIIGLVAGYLVCMMTTETVDEPAISMPAPTPQVIYITPEPTAEPTAVVTAEPVVELMLTPEPVVTEVPTAVPTEVPTAVPTEVPTAVPTAEPTAVVTAEPVVIAESTQAPIAEPAGEVSNTIEEPLTLTLATAEPTAEPVAAPVVTAEPVVMGKPAPVIVPYGEAFSFDTQIKADGSARRTADAEAYETVNLTIQVDAHKGPNYFQSNYADSYMLQGNEAAVEFELTLNEYYGATNIVPQNFLLITFRGDTDADVIQGFQLMDTEIGGKTGIGVYSDTPTTLYKRYPFSTAKDMIYMVVNTYNDGVEGTYWFEIVDPNPEPLYPASFEPLSEGSKGEEVAKLQQKLIDMGLLSDKADGKFGKKTGEAVSACQALLGFTETGIADATLMNALFDI